MQKGRHVAAVPAREVIRMIKCYLHEKCYNTFVTDITLYDSEKRVKNGTV